MSTMTADVATRAAVSDTTDYPLYRRSLALQARDGIAASTPSTTTAGVVLFRPEPAACLALVRTLRASVHTVHLVLNSPIEDWLRDELAKDPGVHLLGGESNLGLGVALNMLVSAALSGGFKRLALFDQDSRPGPLLIEGLRRALDDLIDAGRSPAVVAPRLVVPLDGRAGKAPTYRPRPGEQALAGHKPVAFVPTSGSLLDLSQMVEMGPFRSDYFIDAIDIEWCFRAWAKGHGCWLVEGAEMEHPIGTGVISWPFPRFEMPRQKPFRMHCHIRNSVYGFRLPHVPRGWKIRQALYLPVQMLAYCAHHRFDRSVVRLLMSAVADGFNKRLGPPDCAPGREVRGTPSRAAGARLSSRA